VSFHIVASSLMGTVFTRIIDLLTFVMSPDVPIDSRALREKLVTSGKSAVIMINMCPNRGISTSSYVFVGYLLTEAALTWKR
jgi:hypothetical protein